MSGKRNFLITICLFFAIILSSSVFSIGISPGKLSANMRYGQSEEFEFLAVNTMDVPMEASITLEGDLAEYAELSHTTLSFDGSHWETKPFTLKINYPSEQMNPGIHDLGVVVTELRTGEGGIQVRAAVYGMIYIREALTEKYAEVRISAESKNLNETVPIKVVLSNYGSEIINSATGVVEVYYGDERKKILPLASDGGIAVFESAEFWAYFDTTGFTPGRYTAKVVMNYDGKETSAETDFNVGVLKVSILNFTKTAYAGTINPFEITVKNEWNDVIDGVSANVLVIENSTTVGNFKTPSEKLNKFEEATLSGYLDATGIEPGEYYLQIYLNYHGLQTYESGKITIEAKTAGPSKEKPVFMGEGFLTITLTPAKIIGIMVFVIVILLAVIVLILVRSRRKR